MNSAAFASMILVALVACGSEEYCERKLQSAWEMATVGRIGDDERPIRPTADEARALRALIQRCKRVRPRFDLVDNLKRNDVQVWGKSNVFLLAVEVDDVSLLNELVSEGHSYDGLPNTFGVSTLYFATYRQAANAFSWALENGIDPNLSDTEGISPLMIAAVLPQDRIESIQRLIDAGADVDALDTQGRTALGFAIRSGHFENAHLLVKATASLGLTRNGLVRELESAQSKTGKARVQEAIDYFDEKFGVEHLE